MEVTFKHIFPVAISFFSTVLIIKILFNFAIAIDLVDSPDHRKVHKGNIPLIGGISVLCGFTLACLINPAGLNEFSTLFFSLILLSIIGVLDDHGDVSIMKRFCVQILSCLIMIFYGGISIITFGDLTGFSFPILSGFLEVPITVFCVVGVINALNLIDGIDGLCASLSIIAFSGIIILHQITSSNHTVSLIVYFVSALLAFLLINLSIINKFIPKVFLGDAGTTMIGFILCWYFIKLSNGSENNLFRPITAVWLLSIPIMDTVAVFLRRLYERKSPWKAGRDHIHHILLMRGFKHYQVLIILIGVSIIASSVGIYCEVIRAPEYYLFYGYIIYFILYMCATSYLLSLNKNC